MNAATQKETDSTSVGSPIVFVRLKRLLGLETVDADAERTIIGPDQYPLRANSPLKHEHEMLSALYQEAIQEKYLHNIDVNKYPSGREILALPPDLLGRVVLAATERHVNERLGRSVSPYAERELYKAQTAVRYTMEPLAVNEIRLSRDELFDLLFYFSAEPLWQDSRDSVSERLVSIVEQEAKQSQLTPGELRVLRDYRGSRIQQPPLGTTTDEITRLTTLIGDAAEFYLVPGEAWTDSVNDDLTRLSGDQKKPWIELLKHALSAESARPSGKWVKTCKQLVAAIGEDRVYEALEKWLALVPKTRTIFLMGFSVESIGPLDFMHDQNATCLRGLLWTVQTLSRSAELLRTLVAVALAAYKKLRSIGARSIKVGNAAVYAISEIGSMEAVGQLAMLKVRIKQAAAQKEIEKAFLATANALGLPREEIEEMGVPSYGLEEVGRRCDEFSDYRAELRVDGSSASLNWQDSAGKALKSVPAKVKAEFKDDLKELQQALKDIQGMLPAQRDRLESLFLAPKPWSAAAWRERYLDHPLVGTLVRRLIWLVDGKAALFLDGNPTEVEGKPVELLDKSQISLWHPIGRSIDEVTAWRKELEARNVTQPFKQAHREVYLLTDAERNTGTYSNRFASHIVRQHQFNALGAARRWKTKALMMIDDSVPPPVSKQIPQNGLRAEFWINGAGDDPTTDGNDSGTYLRLATDQVRFYRTDIPTEGPVPLVDVPEIVFSEIMRDVDLFVGVASVGNDPTWYDGGPDGRYREYWTQFSFGQLSESASTRKQVLEQLVPRLKIANRCTFEDRFLVVRGDKRIYKIHLGSSNILMKPNDQYLCIVPDARASAKKDKLFLPFEGDATLSVIISKAFLLAEDKKIKDPTILRQIDSA